MVEIEIEYLRNFEKSFKKIFKKYKYTAKNDLTKILDEIKENPKMGIDLGDNLYKIRLANSAKNQGKSSGYRVITYYIDESEIVFLVDIYDKSSVSSVSKEELVKIIEREMA
jgi:hypothetical protein